LRLALVTGSGAIAIAVIAVVGSLAFLSFRGKEQLRVLGLRRDACVRGEVAACDLLRSACLKRGADACVAMADALLAPGVRHDPKAAEQLLEDACTYLHGAACYRAGRMLMTGNEVPKDEARGKELVARACSMRVEEACAP
jgi:TPR repeat protein